MMTNFADMMRLALWHAAVTTLHTFLAVFAANPWPFLGAGAIALVGALLPRTSRR
jgi:hypothetical protein